MQNNKICLTTFIYGVKYQGYIPFLVYSCHKAYPDYDIVLFLYEALDSNISKQLDLIGKKNVVIKERCFNDCPNMDSLKAKSLRWVLWDDQFREYDYLYIVDIDMFYIREPKELCQQHVEHMSTTDLPYDNLVRCLKSNPFQPVQIAYRIKKAGFQNLWGYFFDNRCDYRLSGLHFIKVGPYFNKLNEEKREDYRLKIYNGSYLKHIYSCNNETFLYRMMQEVGMCPEKLGRQTNSTNMLDFDNCTRSEFRPHHGIHMGIFREEVNPGNSVLDSKAYSFYISKFINESKNDVLFQKILDLASDDIRAQFNRMYKYYSL